MNEAQGQCVSCGFLALRGFRSRLVKRARGHYEVHTDERADPGLAWSFTPDSFTGEIDCMPVCFMRVADLPREVERILQSPTESIGKADATSRVFNLNRVCESWCQYTPGFDPKDHLIEFKARRLEHDRQEFQHGMFEIEQTLKLTQDTALQGQVERERRRDRRLTWAAIILGVIIGSAQVLTALASVLLTISKDAAGYPFVKRVLSYFAVILP